MNVWDNIKKFLGFSTNPTTLDIVVKEQPKQVITNYLITGIDLIAKEVAKAKFIVKYLDTFEIPSDVIYKVMYYYLLNGKVALGFNSLEDIVVIDDFSEKNYLVSNQGYFSKYITFYNPKGSSLENLKPFLYLETELVNYLKKIFNNAGIQGIKANIRNQNDLENTYALLNVIKSKISQGNIFVLPSDFQIETSNLVNIQNLIEIEKMIQKVIANYLNIPESIFTMLVEKGSYALAKEQLKTFYYIVVSSYLKMIENELKKFYENETQTFEDVLVDTSNFWYLEETYNWSTNEVVLLYQTGIISKDEARKLLNLSSEISEVSEISEENEEENEEEKVEDGNILQNENISQSYIDEKVEFGAYDTSLKTIVSYYKDIKPIEKKVFDYLLEYVVNEAIEIVSKGNFNVVYKKKGKGKKVRKNIVKIFLEMIDNFIEHFIVNNQQLKDFVKQAKENFVNNVKNNTDEIISQRLSFLNEVYNRNINQAVNDAINILKQEGEKGKTLTPYELQKQLKTHYQQTKNYVLWRIARTETQYFYQHLSNELYNEIIPKIEKTGKYVVLKKWNASLDNQTRNSHRQLGNMDWIPFNESWVLNGIEFHHPLQNGLPAKEVINCRCRLITKIVEYDDKTKTYKDIDGVDIQNNEG